MHNYETSYPDVVDKKIFFSDMDLKYSDTLEEFQEHLKKTEYRQASECLQDSDVDYYGSYIANLLNRRCNAIGSFLLQKPIKKQSTFYQVTEPSELTTGMSWISD